jgi:hypothetical protein
MIPPRMLVAEIVFTVLFRVHFKSNTGASSFEECFTEENWHEFPFGHVSGGCGNFHTNTDPE